MDFVPVLTAFVATLVGVFGGKWDHEKRGLGKLPWSGWIAAVLAVVALGHGVWTLNEKNRQISDVARVKQIAYDQILVGVDFLLLHLADREVRELKSNTAKFARLREPAYLDQIGKTSLVNYTGAGVVTDGVDSPGFTHAWELFDFNITRGEQLLNDSLVKYGHLLEPEAVVRVNEVLRNNFFRAKFRFRHNQIYLDEALGEWKRAYKDSPWGSLGLYYFDAVYEGASKRPGKYEDYLQFLSKIQGLVDYVAARQSSPSVMFRSQK